MKIVKSFDKNIPDAEIASGVYTIGFCSWERLKPYLEQASNGREVIGIRIDEKGIELILK